MIFVIIIDNHLHPGSITSSPCFLERKAHFKPGEKSETDLNGWMEEEKLEKEEEKPEKEEDEDQEEDDTYFLVFFYEALLIFLTFPLFSLIGTTGS